MSLWVFGKKGLFLGRTRECVTQTHESCMTLSLLLQHHETKSSLDVVLSWLIMWSFEELVPKTPLNFFVDAFLFKHPHFKSCVNDKRPSQFRLFLQPQANNVWPKRSFKPVSYPHNPSLIRTKSFFFPPFNLCITARQLQLMFLSGVSWLSGQTSLSQSEASISTV